MLNNDLKNEKKDDNNEIISTDNKFIYNPMFRSSILSFGAPNEKENKFFKLLFTFFFFQFMLQTAFLEKTMPSMGGLR